MRRNVRADESLRKATDPAGRMGVYRRFEDVPPHHRLEVHADAYGGRDVFGEYLEWEKETYGYDSERYHQIADRARRYWTEHMAACGRHPALARPMDVERFFADLLDRMEPDTAYRTYFTRLESFYDYLLGHISHPHLYSPVLVSAHEFPDGATRAVWDFKIGTNDKR